MLNFKSPLFCIFTYHTFLFHKIKMPKAKSFIVFLCYLLLSFTTFAKGAKPDTVTIGIYVTSIHDIDFKQKEYTATFWLWLKYKNKNFDFDRNLEVPMAKTVTKS